MMHQQPTSSPPRPWPIMLLAMTALLVALWAGLGRLGWTLPMPGSLPSDHGPLLLGGFLGTVIGLERAVALGRRWPLAAPLLSGGGALVLILSAAWSANPAPAAGPWLILLGSLGLVATYGVILRRQTALFTLTMTLGAVAWLVGNGLWITGRAIPNLVWWWVGFLVLTIVGERLELSRLMRPSPAVRAAFAAATGLLLAGLAVSVVNLDAGTRLAGLGMLALALWLGRYDIARRTVRQKGLTRYIALCLLGGYAWLGAGGLLALAQGEQLAGPGYDAVLHAVLVGFVFAMIFGHALVIFPAVAGISVPYHPALYAPLALLHGSLLLRLAGDLVAHQPNPARLWGGGLNVVAILLFLLLLAALVRRGEATSQNERR